jgi:hypothetical protein
MVAQSVLIWAALMDAIENPPGVPNGGDARQPEVLA